MVEEAACFIHSLTAVKKYAAKGVLCPLGGVWNMASWRMQGRHHLKKYFKVREKE